MLVPSRPRSIFLAEENQALRLRRFLFATLIYLAAASLLAAAYLMGFLPGMPVAVALTWMLLVNVALYATFRSGLNLRFDDPSLTALQMFSAISLQMYIIFNMENGRGLALVFTFIVFLFGVYRFSRRDFVSLILYTLAAYALVVNLLMHWRPEAIQSVYLEWLSWLLLAVVLPAFGLMGGRMSELRERLRASNQQLEHLVQHDSLTGLANRRKFAERFEYDMARAVRAQTPLSLLMIDIDFFKAINDQHGHLAGDACLKSVAALLAESVREVDLVARFGGEEFVVLLPETSAEQSLATAERIRSSIEAHPVHIGEGARALALTVSIGAASVAGATLTLEELVARADEAVYRAKRAGRNRVCREAAR